MPPRAATPSSPRPPARGRPWRRSWWPSTTSCARALASGGLPDEGRVLYVSPLKALASDVHQNLQVPFQGIGAELAAEGVAAPGIRVLVRHGDTPQRERTGHGPASAPHRGDHPLVPLPDAHQQGRPEGPCWSRVHTIIVDEESTPWPGPSAGPTWRCRWRASTPSPGPPPGASASRPPWRPIDEVARLLVGTGAVDAGGPLPTAPSSRPAQPALQALGGEVPRVPPRGPDVQRGLGGSRRVAALVRDRRTALVFVDTRRLAERVARHLASALGPDAVAAHRRSSGITPGPSARTPRPGSRPGA